MSATATLHSQGGRPSRTHGAAWRAIGLAPVALVAVAEAAWISVVGGLVQEFSLHPPGLGIPELVAFVVAGMLAARLLGRRAGRRWPSLALMLVFVAGLAGWLGSPDARAALRDGILPALSANPGGWVAGLALLRGFAHARLPIAEGRVALMLGVGVPGLAVASIVGGMVGEPFRTRFLGEALAASLVFVVAAMLALALARLTEVGANAGFDWRRNPSWLVLMVALLIVTIVAAIPLSAVAGVAIETLVAVALGPLLIAGLLTGFDRTQRRIFVLVIAVGVIVVLLIRFFARHATTASSTSTGSQASQSTSSTADQVASIGLGGILLAIAVIGILILAAIWMERAQTPAEDLVEESRTIDRGTGGPPRRSWRPRLGRRPAPARAAAAYVALVEDLREHRTLRRDAGETPAEHAARLRATGRGSLSLDLLAADYELDRYAGRNLSEVEHGRAVGRWRALRRVMPRRAGPQPLGPQPPPR